MLEAAELVAGTFTWISSSSVIIANAVQLSDKITWLLRTPRGAELEEEEREALDTVKGYLVGCIEPLCVCREWARARVCVIDRMVGQAESVIEEALRVVRPLLLGERPRAAAAFAAGRGGGSSSGGLRLRTQLQAIAERLRMAMGILQTAILTVQMAQLVDARSPAVCLATLLAAHRRAVTTSRCTGAVQALRGRLLVSAELWDAKVAAEYAASNAAFARHRRAKALPAPRVRAQGTQAARWHRLGGTYQILLLRASPEQDAETCSGETCFLSLSLATGSRAGECSEMLENARRNTVLHTLLTGEPLVFRIAAAQNISYSEAASAPALAESLPAICACANDALKWVDLATTDDEESNFERVEIEDDFAHNSQNLANATNAPKPSSAAGARSAPSKKKCGKKKTTEVKPPTSLRAAKPPPANWELPAQTLTFPLDLFSLHTPDTHDPDAPPRSPTPGPPPPDPRPAFIFVANEKYTKSQALCFLYLARLLLLSHHSDDAYENVTHESLARLLR